MSAASKTPKHGSAESNGQPLLDSRQNSDVDIRSFRASGPSVGSYVARYNGKAPDALVFKGGGTKGVAYTGAMIKLEEANVLKGVKKFAGSSAGSQVAAMVAFGYTGEELKEINRNAPWRQLLDSDRGFCGPCRNLSRLFRHYGICRGQFLQDYLDDLFQKKCGRSLCTFQQLFEMSGTELRLGACNMVNRKFEFLDRHTQPNMPICLACRASSSIPIVFKPVRWQNALYVDGGLEGNLPISAFSDDDSKILAFNLRSESQESRPRQAPAHLMDFLKQSAEMLFEAAQGVHGVNTFEAAKELAQKGVDIINISTGSYGALDTDMRDEEVEGLVQAGYQAVQRYLCPENASAAGSTYSAGSTSEGAG